MKNLIATLIIVTTPSLGQWTQSYSSPPNGILFAIASDGQTVFAGGTSGIVHSTDSGLTWGFSGLADRWIYSLAFQNQTVFAGTDSGLYLSTDNGSTWQSSRVLSGMPIRSLCVNGNSLLAGTGFNGIYRSGDNGATWQASSTGLTDNWINTIISDGSMLYAGLPDGICSSSDSGNSWSPLGTSAMNGNVRGLASVNGILFAGGVFGIARSTDAGATWALVDSGLTQTFILGLRVFQSTVFAYGWGGIFLTRDTGSTWSEANLGLPTTNIVHIQNQDTTYIPSPVTHSLSLMGTSLFAGIDSNGVWKRPLSQITSFAELEPTHAYPEHFFLSQNFPNPFNPTTRITFAIPHPSNVTITVFDLLGRKVHTIVSRQFAAGTFEVTWDASALPSGVYVVNLQAGDFRASRKMILEK